ncbi:family 20 glycosylhydrolase [uncultured Microbacterium sp.]|uniref:family 20 glycosylhydrolase n=1 Tax=uncultured Microbacterium sp. TaxID=191216 RepID=UPI0026181451|nr:family 20 glycosylhydrolase [uncultured Microbacterium sp.]
MTHLNSPPRRRLPRLLVAGVASAALALGTLAVAGPAAAAVDLPDVIPSIDGWESSGGTFSAASDITIAPGDGGAASESERMDAIAGILRDELATQYTDASIAEGGDGDIRFTIDADRDDLGDEGYELEIDDSIVITAADPAGIFYGTRTVVQMLTQQSELPQGSVIDVPAYEERGVTVCACVINISTDFIDRLIEEMGFLKLNTMLVELKLKVDGYPETNTWSYYTKDDIRGLVEKAKAHGIDVIPEINSPGHMEIWLENLPELQLTNENTGAKDEVRMDITKDASFDFYTDLIDEYFEAFDSEYWHMGVDEYMLGSGYANYPQIKQFAQEQFGEGATENDVVAWYVNKVNDYVKAQGKTLRIWNDGVMADNAFVRFDTDIIVEHWNQAGSSIRPQQFIDWGHTVNNISNSLYMVRDGYGINSRALYDQGWTPEQFYGQKVTSGTEAILGARMSIWPDGGTPGEAENTTEERMFEPLRFVAQSTWSASRPWDTFDGFRAAMDTIGHAPLWDDGERHPLPEGAFTLSSDAGALSVTDGGRLEISDAGTALTFAQTADGYYTITAPDGRCVDIARDGTMRLNVPVGIGADLRVAACSDTTIQRWEVREADGGFTLRNAASQQFVSISDGLVDVPVAGAGFTDVADGRVVQTPADWGRTVWEAVGEVSMTPKPATISLEPGTSTDVSFTITNMRAETVEGASVRVAGTAAGFTVLPSSVAVDALESGAATEVAFTVHNIAASGGTDSVAFEMVDASGAVIASAAVSTSAVCSADSIRPAAISDVSSEQTTGEPAPNGPAAAAIDGDPATYWHTQWSPSDAPYPHAIVVDLGEEQSICGLWYTGRSYSGSGGVNGRIADYEVYASATASTIDGEWGDAVATGTFANSGDAQLASFAPQSARYVKLVALSEIGGNPWATIGELAVAGPAAELPVYETTLEIGSAEVRAGGEIEVSGAGFAPGEGISFALEPVDAAPGAARSAHASAVEVTVAADADGAFAASVPVAADTAAGAYRLVVSGAASSASAAADITVLATDGEPGAEPGETPGAEPGDGATGGNTGGNADGDGSLAVTGVEVTGGVIAGILLLLAGFLFVRRRRAATN